MRLKDLRKEVEDYYDIDISTNTRKQVYVDAKRVFSKIAYGLGYTYRIIGEEINLEHCTILHHVKTFNLIDNKDKILHDKILKNNDINFIKPVAKKSKPEKVVDPDVEHLLKEMNSYMVDWDKEVLKDFINTRVNPYRNSLSSVIERIQNENKKEVKGAILNTKVKNPFLS